MMNVGNRKRGMAMLLAAALLSVCAGVAFAQESGKAMTIEEMNAVYEASAARMNTVASYPYEADALERYEESVRAQGGEFKEDMVLVDLPGEEDMPYAEALEFAYAQITEKFGTPRSELEQMGVYPTFYTFPYTDMEPEWDFYITPRRDCDIMMDHVYPDAGEYIVSFTARSAQVDVCVWHLEKENRPDGELRWSEDYLLEKQPAQPEEALGG